MWKCANHNKKKNVTKIFSSQERMRKYKKTFLTIQDLGLSGSLEASGKTFSNK
jgi:hypothetical protein